jgi:hypothetical protein
MDSTIGMEELYTSFPLKTGTWGTGNDTQLLVSDPHSAHNHSGSAWITICDV